MMPDLPAKIIPQPNTYRRLTAESILAYVDLHFSPDALDTQLAAQGSFYAKLVQIPARITMNSMLDEQCRNTQAYAQERLIEYILSGQEDKMVEGSDLSLKNELEAKRQQLIALGNQMTILERDHYQLMIDTYMFLEEQVKHWSENIETEVDKIWTLIQQCKPDISSDYKVRLSQLVKTQAAGVIIPDTVLKSLNIKQDTALTATERAVLQLLLEARGL